MPCRSEYMEPNKREEESRLVARLLVYVMRAQGVTPLAQYVHIADNYYGDQDRVDELTAELCRMVRGMSDDDASRIVYNGRSKAARRLADWWERHEQADRVRMEKEKKDSERKRIRERALAKLTPEERDALLGDD